MIMKKVKIINALFIDVRKLIAAIVFAVTLIPTISGAQPKNSLNITFRPGANFPVEDLGDARLKNGGGFETTVSYKFLTHLSGYAGWGWNNLKEKESTDTSGIKFKET